MIQPAPLQQPNAWARQLVLFCKVDIRRSCLRDAKYTDRLLASPSYSFESMADYRCVPTVAHCDSKDLSSGLRESLALRTVRITILAPLSVEADYFDRPRGEPSKKNSPIMIFSVHLTSNPSISGQWIAESPSIFEAASVAVQP